MRNRRKYACEKCATTASVIRERDDVGLPILHIEIQWETRRLIGMKRRYFSELFRALEEWHDGCDGHMRMVESTVEV